MTPESIPPEGVARAISALPTALFIGDVSGPLNAEAATLSEELDPKFSAIQADIAATLELCHAGNEPVVGRLKEDIESLRSGIRGIQTMAASLLNGTYVAPQARERIHRQASLASVGRSNGAELGKNVVSPADREFLLEL